MSATLTEDQEDASALLATVRHQMSGREIDICERIISGEVATLPEPPEPELMERENWADADAGGSYATEAEQPLFDSLKIQFYAQITSYKNGGQRA